jgi:hypothetical protein
VSQATAAAAADRQGPVISSLNVLEDPEIGRVNLLLISVRMPEADIFGKGTAPRRGLRVRG